MSSGSGCLQSALYAVRMNDTTHSIQFCRRAATKELQDACCVMMIMAVYLMSTDRKSRYPL